MRFLLNLIFGIFLFSASIDTCFAQYPSRKGFSNKDLLYMVGKPWGQVYRTLSQDYDANLAKLMDVSADKSSFSAMYTIKGGSSTLFEVKNDNLIGVAVLEPKVNLEAIIDYFDSMPILTKVNDNTWVSYDKIKFTIKVQTLVDGKDFFMVQANKIL